jgi:hypothetical protein
MEESRIWVFEGKPPIGRESMNLKKAVNRGGAENAMGNNGKIENQTSTFWVNAGSNIFCLLFIFSSRLRGSIAVFRMKKILLSLCICLWGGAAFAAPALQEGDIVFQSQGGNFSKAIRLATHSPYNHVGMVFIRKGKPCVLEAVQPVRFTPLDRWIENGDGNHFVAKRLKNADKVLTPEVLRKMEALAQKCVGKKYSFTFAWSEDSFYCSGLVWKVYHDTTGLELGKFQKFRELDLSSPLVKKELKKYFGPFVPLDHEVISPEQMFESGLLTTVEEK